MRQKIWCDRWIMKFGERNFRTKHSLCFLLTRPRSQWLFFLSVVPSSNSIIAALQVPLWQRGLICLLFGRRQETFLHWAWAHALCKCSNGELKTMANVVCIGFFFLLWLFSFCLMLKQWLEETLWGQISGALAFPFNWKRSGSSFQTMS